MNRTMKEPCASITPSDRFRGALTFESWIRIPAVFENKKEPLFGIAIETEHPPDGGAYRYKPVINSFKDVAKIKMRVFPFIFDGLYRSTYSA